MSYYLPNKEEAFDAWLANFVAYVNNNMAELGLDAEMIAPVNTTHSAWSTAFAAHNAAVLAARVARGAKSGAWDAARAAVRVLVKRIQGNPDVTDVQKLAMGIINPEEGTAGGMLGVTRPQGKVDISQRMQHKVSFVDEADAGTKAKPKGILGCEIRVKIGDVPPVDSSETQLVAIATRAPFTVEYTGAEANKTAHYMMRWIDTKGNASPWSETVSATIAA